MAALGAGIEEIEAGGERVTGGGDGFLPLAGGALVVAGGWADGHGLCQSDFPVNQMRLHLLALRTCVFGEVRQLESLQE